MKQQPNAARSVPTAPLTAVVHGAMRRWFRKAHKVAWWGRGQSRPFLFIPHMSCDAWAPSLAPAHLTMSVKFLEHVCCTVAHFVSSLCPKQM